MAKVVLGIATSHGPLVNLEGALWEPYTRQVDYRRKNLYDAEGKFYATYADFARQNGDRYAKLAEPAHLIEQAGVTHLALDRLAADLEKANPDVVLIIGDDQEELFTLRNNPALSIFYGSEVITHTAKSQDPIWQIIQKGYGLDARHVYAGVPGLARDLIVRLIDKGFDVGAASEVGDTEGSGFGHAFGFIVTRLMGERKIPIVPILLNTYYPPNQPTPARCYNLGLALTEALQEIPDDLRVAVVGSGGLSHHITNEALDRELLDAIRANDADRLRKIPASLLNGGSSEIRCWIAAAGACSHLKVAWDEYQPVYRTPPGTGIGLGFVCWKEAEN